MSLSPTAMRRAPLPRRRNALLPALALAIGAAVSAAAGGEAGGSLAPAPLPGAAWPAPFDDCINRPGDPRDCVPIIACIGGKLWFSGRARGAARGELAGFLSDGTACRGSWTSRNLLGFGQADVICADGRSARVFFTYQDERTGTAVGRGVTSAREQVKSWSGRHIRRFLAGRGIAEELICGGEEIPISRRGVPAGPG